MSINKFPHFFSKSQNFKQMKTFTSLLFSISIMVVFTQCAGSQFVNNPPFVVESVTQHQLTDSNNNDKGTLFKIALKNVDTNAISFEKIYFNNKGTNVLMALTDENTLITAKFVRNISGRNLVLHKDPKKEIGNKPPVLVEKPPFKMKDNEAVLTYTENGITKYFKLENIKKGKAVIQN
ncbi:MAG: hypothetical protein CR989_01925 [Flavobacteriales bacterium]|nr:MAG: hypothetical protein CR989_01925 [Flavobacteriales bacterium]